LEDTFWETYESLDPESVPAGTREDRESARTSPVVPRSARRVMADGEGYVLVAVVILRSFRESFRAACKASKWTAREFAWNPDRGEQAASEVADLEVRMRSTLGELVEQSRRLYGELIGVAMHVRCVRAFVDAILRYGLPPDFAFVLLHPKEGKAPRAIQALRKAYPQLLEDDDDGEDLPAGVAGGSDVRIPGVPVPCFGFDLNARASEK